MKNISLKEVNFYTQKSSYQIKRLYLKISNMLQCEMSNINLQQCVYQYNTHLSCELS